MAKTWWKQGDWNALCDVCARKRKSSDLIERWDHLMVCKPSVKMGCWEPQHPQNLQHPIPDDPPIPWSNPEPADVFVDFPGFNSVAVTANAASVVITDSDIATTSQLLILGNVPADPTMGITRITVGAGTATVFFSPVPKNDLTLYYRVIG